jgi:NTE family protein
MIFFKVRFSVLYPLFVLFCFFSASCQPQFQTYADIFPSSVTQISATRSPRISLVLGAGGARGMAHVGVLEELERIRLPIDLIVGCSAGSIVGALYSKHLSSSFLREELSKLRRSDFIEISWFKRCHGLSYGNGLRNFLLKHLGDISFENLHIPLIVVATHLSEGKLCSFHTGKVVPAVHASSAFPFVFSPVELDDALYVDGGVINPIPVDVARKEGALFVIAVDISSALPSDLPNNLFGVAKRCVEIQFYHQSQGCSRDADIVIRPDLYNLGAFEDNTQQIAYEAGKQAARQALPEIYCLLKEKALLSEEEIIAWEKEMCNDPSINR